MTKLDTPPADVNLTARPQRHIGLDCREAYRESPRGIGLYCRNLMHAFPEVAPELTIELYHERPRPSDMPKVAASLHPNHLGMKGGRWHLWERLAMPLRMRSDGIELYHGTYNTIPPKPPLLGGPKLVVTVHDVIVTWYDDDLDDPYVRYVRKVTPRVLRQADAIVTVSQASRQDIAERFQIAPDRIEVIYNGINNQFLEDPEPEAVAKARETIADGRPYLYAIGASLARKNTDALFPMFRALIDSGQLRDELLVVSGLSGASLEARRRAAEAAGVTDRVRLIGYQDVTTLQALFAGAELFIYPTFVEGWGIPILESLACGTPVATGNATALPEAGGDHAYYFDAHDPQSILTTVHRAYQDRKNFARNRTEAIERARSFTWRKHAQELANLYHRLLDEPGR